MLPTYAVYVRENVKPPRVRAMVKGTRNEAAMAGNTHYRLLGVFPNCSAGKATQMGKALLAK